MRERLPFIAPHNFEDLKDVALHHAEENIDNLFGGLLILLADCHHVCQLSGLEQVGSSYHTLRRIGRAVGMSEEQQQEWNSLAESIPLSERHGVHSLEKLQTIRREAA